MLGSLRDFRVTRSRHRHRRLVWISEDVETGAIHVIDQLTCPESLWDHLAVGVVVRCVYREHLRGACWFVTGIERQLAASPFG